MTRDASHSVEHHRICVAQSNYLPWLGYFALVDQADTFVLYDSAQFTKNDWRNRNRIRSESSAFWITIPCITSGRFGQSIRETQVKATGWARKHIASMQSCYSKSPHFAWFEDRLFPILTELKDEQSLSYTNEILIRLIAQDLNITTTVVSDNQYLVAGDRNSKLLQLCQQAGATEYLSGPAASNYLDRQRFMANGIRIKYMDYGSVEEFLIHQGNMATDFLSIVDTIAHCGIDTVREFLRMQKSDA